MPKEPMYNIENSLSVLEDRIFDYTEDDDLTSWVMDRFREFIQELKECDQIIDLPLDAAPERP